MFNYFKEEKLLKHSISIGVFMSFCQECGNELDNDETYCSNCGTKVDAAKADKTSSKKDNSNSNNEKSSLLKSIENNKILVICICIILVVLSSVAYFIISDYLNVVNNTDVVSYENYPEIDKSVIDRFNAYDTNGDGRWTSEEFNNYLNDYSPLTDQPYFNSITFELGYFTKKTVDGESAMDINDFNSFNEMDSKNMAEYNIPYKKPI